MQKKGARRFLVVGSATVDVLAQTSDVERVDIAGKHIERLVCISFASKSELADLALIPGGSAANSAVALQRLGSDATLFSAVGADVFGDMVLDDLRKNGVGTSAVIVKPIATGVGISLIAEGGEKSILVYRGASSDLGPSDVKDGQLKKSEWLFLTSLVSEKNFELFVKLLKSVRKLGKKVVFAPSITMLHRWLPRIKLLRPRFDVVIVNYEEGMFYTGKDDIHGILEGLPGKVVVVTKDVDGAYASVHGSREVWHVPSIKVAIVDTTGAGDTFSGAFAHEYAGGAKVQEALRVAAAAAAMKLTHKGAHYAMTAAELLAFMKKNPVSVRKV